MFLYMPSCNGFGDALPALHRLLRSPLEQLGVQQVQHKQLSHPGGNRPGLEGSLVGAALEDHIRLQPPGDLGKRVIRITFPFRAWATSRASWISRVEPE